VLALARLRRSVQIIFFRVLRRACELGCAEILATIDRYLDAADAPSAARPSDTSDLERINDAINSSNNVG
jgi:hypothetical protein